VLDDDLGLEVGHRGDDARHGRDLLLHGLPAREWDLFARRHDDAFVARIFDGSMKPDATDSAMMGAPGKEDAPIEIAVKT
jgi:hypothetical protein